MGCNSIQRTPSITEWSSDAQISKERALALEARPCLLAHIPLDEIVMREDRTL